MNYIENIQLQHKNTRNVTILNHKIETCKIETMFNSRNFEILVFMIILIHSF